MTSRLRNQLTALDTIASKEIRRIFRIWPQTLLPPVITMSLYLVIFGGLIGSRVGTMDGFGYMEFIIPGLIMMSVITSSYANVVSSFFGARFQRHIEEMLVSPMSNVVILLGFVSGGISRGLCVGLAVTLISLFFSTLQVANIFLTALVVLLGSTLFSLAGFINGVFARNFDDVSIVPAFILTPLTYFGGVFYSIHLLPEFWRAASHLNPILYMVNAFRFGILGVSDINVTVAVAAMIAFIAALTAFSLYLLHRGVGIRQ